MKSISNFNAIESINANNVEGGTFGCLSGLSGFSGGCYRPVVAPVCSIPAVATPKVVATKTPVVDTKTPVLDTKTPVLDTKTPVIDTKTPAVKTPVVTTSVCTLPVISCVPHIKSHGKCGK
jgi:hypothetical protein